MQQAIDCRRPTIDVLIASTERAWGGGEAQARHLARGLIDRGHRCTIAAADGGELLKRLQEEGLSTLTLPGRRAAPGSIWRLRALLKRRRPDVLHMNDSGSVSLAGPAALGLGIAARIASRRVLFPLRHPALYRRVADRVLCVSSSVQSECLRAGLPERSLRIVHDGVELPEEIRHRTPDTEPPRPGAGAPAGSPTGRLLLSVGSLVESKGYESALECAAILRAKRPEVRWKIAGEGTARASLERKIRDLALGGNVELLGFRDDVDALMREADLFVHAATREGLGSSILEAMACGLPVVATDSGGVRDLLRASGQEPRGWLVPGSIPDVLAEAIVEVLDDPVEAASRARNAFRRVTDHFGVDAMVSASLAVYRELLDGSAIPGSSDRRGT